MPHAALGIADAGWIEVSFAGVLCDFDFCVLSTLFRILSLSLIAFPLPLLLLLLSGQ